MSEQHRWLQRRIVAMTRRMGFEPIAEHPPTRADVYVPEVGLAIEVQLRPTQFEQRTAARRAAGASGVLWMLSPDALLNGHQRYLFEQPAVRWRAVDRHTRNAIKPWTDVSANVDARVQVYGTVIVPPTRSDGAVLVTQPMDGYRFLLEVLRGERVWVPPNTPGMPKSAAALVPGGWVRPEHLSRAAAAAAAAVRQGQPGRTADPEVAVPEVASTTVPSKHAAVEIERQNSEALGTGLLRDREDAHVTTSIDEDPDVPAHQAIASAGLVRRIHHQIFRWCSNVLL